MSKKSSQHHLLNADCPFGNNWSTNISCGPYLIIYFPLGFKIMNPCFISSHYIYDFFRLNLGYIPIVFGHLHTCCLLLVCEYMRYQRISPSFFFRIVRVDASKIGIQVIRAISLDVYLASESKILLTFNIFFSGSLLYVVCQI